MISLPACVRLVDPNGEFPILEIDHPSCRARVALQGAHVMEWAPAGADPVLYLSPAAVLQPGKAIRGGIPICWPWFGPHPTDASKPAHGVARNRFWECTACQDDGASVELRFELKDSEATRQVWDHAFSAIVEIRLGAELALSLTTHNTGLLPFSETASLHAYLAVSTVDETELGGLNGATFVEHAGGETVPGLQTGPVRIVGEVDRIYASTADLTVREDHRTIRVHKHGSASTVVWNPGPEKAVRLGDLPVEDVHRFVCVETANAPGAEVTLAPGAHHVLRMRLAVESMQS